MENSVLSHGLTARVTGSEEGADGSGTFVKFVVQITRDGIAWELAKRFSEFHFFYTNVQEHCGGLRTPFPPKTMGRITSTQIQERQDKLNQWINDFLDNVPMTSGLIAQLHTFFQVEQHTGSERRIINTRRVDIASRIAPGHVIKAGYLTKLGGNKQGGAGNWKRRYFVLQDDLKYFENEQAYVNGAAPKGVCKLNTYYVTSETPNPDKEFTVHALPFALVCRAESEEEMNSWVQTLQQLFDMM